MSSRSHSTYHSLQTSLTKNSARAGLGLQASYTYSKALDDTSSVLGGLFGATGVVLQTLPQNPWNPDAEKGPSRAEFFNIFNIVNFGLLNNILRGTGFGVVSKAAGSSRQIQFSLKLIY